MPSPQTFTVAAEQAGQTVAALLRQWLPGQSWKQVRQLVDGRRIKINNELWLDAARRLRSDDTVELLARPAPVVQLEDQLVLRHVDEHLVVVEKPPGVSTVRHPAEHAWLEPRRLLSPTLDDLVMKQIGLRLPRAQHEPRARLRIVHRLDKATSGLVVFARTVQAERGLGRQFAKHEVTRRYLALVPGNVEGQTVRTFLARDRGDGRRGSTRMLGEGKEAITHFAVEGVYTAGEDASAKRQVYTLLSCRLETGRTHQIRIHLAELGHPVCGEKVYNRRPGGAPTPDASGAPRLFLHAVELGFVHPLTSEAMHWDMPLPDDLRTFLARLCAEGKV